MKEDIRHGIEGDKRNGMDGMDMQNPTKRNSMLLHSALPNTFIIYNETPIVPILTLRAA